MKTSTPLRILVADDESLIINIVQAELESIGMQLVGRATDGLQAVELTRQLRPDAVLMDIAMPELDGLAAAARIQQECPTPVVILSAHDRDEDLSRASTAGVGAFLVKPPRAAELDRALSIAIARHADLMELRRVNAELQKTLSEVKILRGMLPICSGCKKIRDDDDQWQPLEAYISQRSDTTFTHSFCPDCFARYFPGATYPHPRAKRA